jgi:hypothetical protein
MKLINITVDVVLGYAQNGTKVGDSMGSKLSWIISVPDQAQDTALIESIMISVISHIRQMELLGRSDGQPPKNNEPTNGSRQAPDFDDWNKLWVEAEYLPGTICYSHSDVGIGRIIHSPKMHDYYTFNHNIYPSLLLAQRAAYVSMYGGASLNW